MLANKIEEKIKVAEILKVEAKGLQIEIDIN